jgi:hypothetical protein
MKKELKITLLTFLFTTLSFAQDCNCKHWKKTYFNKSGEVKYDYDHGCNQPGSSWEFIGYDEVYCLKLVEDEKRRIKDLENTKMAFEISKNTKIQAFKDGYKVLARYGKMLGNTGKWDEVGEPRFGITDDSSFVQWNENGGIEIKGKIKNKQLNGLIEFYDDSNEYLDPFYLFKSIGEFLKIETSWWSWKPDYLYLNEINKFEFEENAKSIGVDHTFHGIYYLRTNNEKKYFSHYYFDNGIVTLFSSPVDEKKARIIHYEVDSLAQISEFLSFKDKLTLLKNKLSEKKNSNINLNEIQKNQLNENEKSLIGNWSNVSSLNEVNSKKDGDYSRYYFLNENFTFNNDRTFSYNGNLVSRLYSYRNATFENPEITFSLKNKNGFWQLIENKLCLYAIDSNAVEFERFRQQYYVKISELLSELNSNDLANLKKSKQWIQLKPIRKKILTLNSDLVALFQCFVDPTNYYYRIGSVISEPTDNLKKLLKFLSNEKTEELERKEVELLEINLEEIKTKKTIIKDLPFKNTLLYKDLVYDIYEVKDYYERLRYKEYLEGYSNFTFTLKGKKQK